MELDIQTRFLPRLPFSCNSIISDKIWRKMSLSLSIFLVLPQISLVKYYETIKILMQIFWYFRSHFHNVAGPGEKSYFEGFFSVELFIVKMEFEISKYLHQCFHCLIIFYKGNLRQNWKNRKWKWHLPPNSSEIIEFSENEG